MTPSFSCTGPLLAAIIIASTAVLSHATAMAAKSVSKGGTIKNVVIAIAMEAEASPFVKHLSLDPDDAFFPPEAPFHAFRGDHGSCELTVVTNGKDRVHGTGMDNCGTVPASLAAFLTLQKLAGEGSGQGGADLLINAGTCGGFRTKGAEIGDVFLTTGAANHDRRIPIPSFDVYGVGQVDSAPVSKLAAEIGAKTGNCTTGNSLDKHDWDMRHMAENDASVKDMEYAAIAWACELNGVPHFGVKVVTDIVDGTRPTDEEFLENLHKAADSLQEALPKVIDHVCGKTHDEL